MVDIPDSTIILYSVSHRSSVPQVFDGVGVLVDVGGGTGATLAMIANRYKHIRGINFDMSHVISEAPSLPGVEHVAGSWFDSIPTGDAVFMKWILHMQNDEDCIKILKNCHRALPDKGKVIVVQSVLPETPESTPAARDSFTMDIIMLVNFNGGKDRTEQEYAKLARDAGFAGAFRSTYIFCNIYALEFTK
ncbi:probable inactive methyltransferase Os04g0175900 [Phragmites australis]|uniref:probable inactive methyltransferase Os04g0175900 n=1 Tax=Phragmites australis TaxID=29695 RepID=UPI002D7766F9|nr:probable inactive methyltransferase Os04g0175900 [Phragmites australis]XP_062197345.1 probable inactive methyltransferase Os04g0175900 [Phragmites australis]